MFHDPAHKCFTISPTSDNAHQSIFISKRLREFHLFADGAIFSHPFGEKFALRGEPSELTSLSEIDTVNSFGVY